jgi:hypothetical protein
MKKLLEWIDQKRSRYGNIVLLLSALALFTFLALVLSAVYAFFIGLAYINPYLVLLLTLILLLIIIYKNRSI